MVDIPVKSTNVPYMSNNMNELLGESLFGKVRRSVLSTLVLNPDRSFYLLELIGLLNCGRGAVQREVARLSASGILQRTRVGNQVHYRANTSGLIYGELRAIFSKTTGLVDLLRGCLDSCRDPVGVAFIHGAYASGTASDHTPIGLVVIGETTMDAVRECTADFAADASRELHLTVLSPADLRRRLSSGDRSVEAVLRGPRIFLAGGKKELNLLTAVEYDLFAGLFQ
jgi:hypothetical protein